jgi:glucan 1,3-beta-glucosidase
MERIKSVNLGNWFVLERWMKPSLFQENNVEGRDETCFSLQVPNLKEVMDHHYKTWITKEDIIWLKNNGINLVRIPLPWWFLGESPYIRSAEYIDDALKMIASCDMDFMLDLHTAPGCQNGFDNGGIEGQLEWHKDSKNIEKTIDILETIAIRYKDYKNFHSIQLLNEPHFNTDIKLIQKFYLDAYKRLRKVLKDKYIVMHDGFRMNEWEDFFTSNDFVNVVLDSHLYQCFGGHFREFDEEKHRKHALGRIEDLKRIEKFVPLIIGEWSLGVNRNDFVTVENINDVEKVYAKAQLEAWKYCSGHTFWSYKIEDPNSGWNLRTLVERGIIDLKEF